MQIEVIQSTTQLAAQARKEAEQAAQQAAIRARDLLLSNPAVVREGLIFTHAKHARRRLVGIHCYYTDDAARAALRVLLMETFPAVFFDAKPGEFAAWIPVEEVPRDER